MDTVSIFNCLPAKKPDVIFLVSAAGVDIRGLDGTKTGASTFRWKAVELKDEDVVAIKADDEEVKEEVERLEIDGVKGVDWFDIRADAEEGGFTFEEDG